jgi:hypothetical protein
MCDSQDKQLTKYEVHLWYKGIRYEGVDLEMIDIEEVNQICQEIQKMLRVEKENIFFDCEDIHMWYLLVATVDSTTIPDGQQTIHIRPFPRGESLFEEDEKGQCAVEIDLVATN